MSTPIRNLTPAAAWDIYVGEQSPAEFMALSSGYDAAGAVWDYLEESPLTADLGAESVDSLFRALVKHIERTA